MCCTLISRSLRQGHSHHRRKESEEEEDDDKAWKCLSRMERGPCLRSYKGPIGWGSAGVTCAQREPPRDRRCHWKGDAWCPEHRRGSHSLEQFPEWKAWNLSVASPDTTGCLSFPNQSHRIIDARQQNWPEGVSKLTPLYAEAKQSRPLSRWH